MSEKSTWDLYIETELTKACPLIEQAGFVLDEEQVHIYGERYLMSSTKLVLLGKRLIDGQQVVIKTSSDPKGQQEIKKEQATRKLLHFLPFAYHTFYSPEEIYSTETNGVLVVVTKYIEEEQGFLEYTSQEQFFLALRALVAQEGAYATTHSHFKLIYKAFGRKTPKQYLDDFKNYTEVVISKAGDHTEIIIVMQAGVNFLEQNQKIMEQYDGFLTHTDFVPHNVRIADNTMYLLDHTSLTFGNKYESWARFMNYIILYNKELEEYFMQYVRDNRSVDEYLVLRLMRVYKIGFLLEYYTRSLEHAQGELYKLTNLRIEFWAKVLKTILDDTSIDNYKIIEYKKLRDGLRSEDEISRQRELKQF